MSFDWQSIVVASLVVAAAAYLGRATWRAWRSRGKPGCGSCGACPSNQDAGAAPSANKTIVPLDVFQSPKP